MSIKSYGDRGATAIFVAISMLLIMGMAALAIDLVGAGFNERRQDQSAADTGVMAGATGYPLGENNDQIVTKALEFVRANLDTIYAEADWRAIWRSCTDPERINFDVGTSRPVTFQPMQEPVAWGGGGTLDCISTGSSYLRVRVPTQVLDTAFGTVIGFDTISTQADAVARIEPASEFAGILPFGIPGGTGASETCLKTSGSGLALPPCLGPNGGGFGEINSEFFGDFFGTPNCGTAGAPELAQNTAIGVDHFIAIWPATDAAAEGVTVGSPHPGDGPVGNYQNVGFDQCRIVGGAVVPQTPGHNFPPNAIRVGTGFSPAPIEDGLISNLTFLGQNSRLQQGPNPTRDIVKRKAAGTETIYPLDNKGPWAYLTGTGACDSASYTAAMATTAKNLLFQTCLTSYGASTTDIFDASIADSPRFAWAPEYWHAVSTTGTSYQPVLSYRMVFVGGIFFNCDASSCAQTFYPDEDFTTPICDPGGGGNCKVLNLGQLSAWLLPDEAVPDSVRDSFPGGNIPFKPTLFR